MLNLEFALGLVCIVVLVAFAYWVGTGHWPWDRAVCIYRFARKQKHFGRRQSMAFMWRILRPWP